MAQAEGAFLHVKRGDEIWEVKLYDTPSDCDADEQPWEVGYKGQKAYITLANELDPSFTHFGTPMSVRRGGQEYFVCTEPYSSATLTIRATPSEARITATYGSGTVNAGAGTLSVTVPKGTAVRWTVYLDGYWEQSGETVVEEDMTIDVMLEESIVSFTIIASPSGADVHIWDEFGVEQMAVGELTVTGHPWTAEWEVDDGIMSKSGSTEVTEDITMYVDLYE